jgi:hypothetical protein
MTRLVNFSARNMTHAGGKTFEVRYAVSKLIMNRMPYNHILMPTCGYQNGRKSLYNRSSAEEIQGFRIRKARHYVNWDLQASRGAQVT